VAKFLHTADWQIGKPFAGIRDESKRAKVQNTRIEAIKRLGEAARTAGAEFVVVAGDLFDSSSADKATVSAACSAIGRIGLPVYAIPGNHDHGGPGSVWNQPFFLEERRNLAPNLTVLLEAKPVECESAVLLPCPLLARSFTTDPTAWLRTPEAFAGLPAGKPRLVLAHGSTQTFDGRWQDEEEVGGASGILDLTRIPWGEVDYLALGDWHGTKQVDAIGKVWFSGTPELDRFVKGGDHDPGNVLVVEALRGVPPRVERQPTSILKWHGLDFDFAADASLDEFQRRLAALLETRAGEDLLELTLGGSLGIEAASKLEAVLETYEARLLRLKLVNRTRIAPTEEEIDALANRTSDPLISGVARCLVEESNGEGEAAEVARIALRELHAACKGGAPA
jgi:DNA repair exonuclease SbcCD nuclease subunit